MNGQVTVEVYLQLEETDIETFIQASRIRNQKLQGKSLYFGSQDDIARQVESELKTWSMTGSDILIIDGVVYRMTEKGFVRQE